MNLHTKYDWMITGYICSHFESFHRFRLSLEPWYRSKHVLVHDLDMKESRCHKYVLCTWAALDLHKV
jgi:hypothetical protein